MLIPLCRHFIWLLCFHLFMPTNVWAQDADASKSSAQSTAPKDKPIQEKESKNSKEPSRSSIFVQDLEGDANVSADHLRALNGFVVHGVSQFDQFNVVTKEQLRRAGDLFAEQQSAGCGVSEECLAELADAMGARYVVYGRAAYVEENYLLAMSLMDSQSVEVIQRVHLQEKKLLDLGQTIDEQMIFLLKPLLRKIEQSRSQKTAASQQSNTGTKGEPLKEDGTQTPAEEMAAPAGEQPAHEAEDLESSAASSEESTKEGEAAAATIERPDAQSGVSMLTLGGGIGAGVGAVGALAGGAGAVVFYMLFQAALERHGATDAERANYARLTAGAAVVSGVSAILALAGTGVAAAGFVSE